MAAKSGNPSRKKNIIKALIIVAAFVILLAFLESRWFKDYSKTDNSSYGTSDFGVKALFESLKEFGRRNGFSVSRQVKYSRFLPENSLTLCFGYSDMLSDYGTELSDIRKYVESGSSFMYITLEDEENGINSLLVMLREFGYDSEEIPEITEGIWGTVGIYSCAIGDGTYYMAVPGYFVSNMGLKEEPDHGAYLMTLIKDIVKENGYESVVFEEYFVGVQDSSTGEIIGYGFIFLLAELCIALIVFCLIKAFPLGDPKPVYEIEKSSETAHIEALAGLYRKTGSGKIAFEINMESLLRDLSPRYGLSLPGGACPYMDVCDEAYGDSSFIGKGLDELINVYRNREAINISKGDLQVLLGKINEIRREL